VLESRNDHDSGKSCIALPAAFFAIALIAQTPPSGTARSALPRHLHRISVSRCSFYQIVWLITSSRFEPACIHNGTLEWVQTFGVISVGGEPVTPETLFRLVPSACR